MKSAINLSLIFIVYCLIGSMESNAMSLKTGLIWCCVVGLVEWLINRKKSATSRTRNGQAYPKRHTKYNHHKFTPYKGGMSR